MFNVFTAVARVCADAQVRDSGNAKICNLRMVTSKNRKVRDQWEERTFFFNAVGFNKGADRLADYRKGDLVVVSGEIECSTYTNRDGESKTVYNLNVQSIEPLGKRGGGSNSDDDIDIDIDDAKDLPF